jgi:hypothetical protein
MLEKLPFELCHILYLAFYLSPVFNIRVLYDCITSRLGSFRDSLHIGEQLLHMRGLKVTEERHTTSRVPYNKQKCPSLDKLMLPICPSMGFHITFECHTPIRAWPRSQSGKRRQNFG